MKDVDELLDTVQQINNHRIRDNKTDMGCAKVRFHQWSEIYEVRMYCNLQFVNLLTVFNISFRKVGVIRDFQLVRLQKSVLDDTHDSNAQGIEQRLHYTTVLQGMHSSNNAVAWNWPLIKVY